MKESSKMTSAMVKVIKCFIELFIDSNKLFIALIGKYFWISGNRYEGEWKDGN